MKKSELLTIKANGNALAKKVVNVILDQGDTDDMVSFMKDVVSHGCVSGVVGELIYYNDTVAFYKKYRKEINTLLKEYMFEIGYISPAEAFGKQWDNDDPLGEDTHNMNLLAWFGFEATCRQIADELGFDY
jgi:hypothetical protein